MPDEYPWASIFCAPAQSKCTWTCHKRHFVRKFSSKMPYAYPWASIFCAPAQVEMHMTCHKRHFVRKFTRKMLDATATTSIEHRALTLTIPSLTVRTPSVWPHCLWENMVNFQFWLVQPHQFPFNHSTTIKSPLNHH